MNPVPATIEIPGYQVGTWKADPVHSEIAFTVRHLMISKTRGRFTSYDVTLVTSEDLLSSSVTATIDLASIDTGNEMRDNHLRTADYLEIEKYPTMSYRSTGVRRTADGWAVDGELTLHGVTRRVPMAVEVNGFGPDPWGGQRAGFSATAEIDRHDFGIDLRTPLEAGGVTVGDKVSISLEIQAVLQKPDGVPASDGE
ncbi:YceI family protein [Streptomyces sp. NPDC001843]|uniref:YceI family protein n=1 Tax=Streptomyces sp. NPDC001843 TaxID=3364617 RepID=UPI0036C54679